MAKQKHSMSSEQSSDGPIELAAMIDAVRDELRKAEREGKDLSFIVREVELELALMVERSEQVSGGLKVLVLQVGAEGNEKIAQTHTVRLKLTPFQEGDGGHGRRDIIVSGEGVPSDSRTDDVPMGG